MQDESDLTARVQKLEEQVQFLASMYTKQSGEILGATAGVRALVIAHPDLSAARDEVVHQLDLLQSIGLGKPVSDALLDGIQQARSQMLPTEKDILRRGAR